MKRRIHAAVAGVLLLGACGPATPQPPTPATPSKMPSNTPPRFQARPASASPIDFERIAAFPPPGWHVPRQLRFSPDGKLVTYLASESQSDQMALHAYDVASGASRVLLRAGDLDASDKPMSREEELRRERQRKRIKGITGYQWAKHAPVVLLPLGGQVFLRTTEGSVRQLTDSDEPAIDPKICDDGSWVAFARGRELFSVEVASGKEHALTSGAEAGVTRGQSDFNGQEEFGEPSGHWWAPDCRTIAFLEVDERQVGQVAIMGYRGGADLQNLRYPRAGTANPRVRIGFVGRDEAVGRAGAAARFSTLPEGEGWGQDHYLGRVRWSADGKLLYLVRLSRDQRRAALVRIDAATGAAKHIAERSDPHWTDMGSLHPLADGSLLWATWHEGHRHIEQLDGKNGKLLQRLTTGNWEVDEIVGVDPRAKRVLFTANRDAVLDRQLYAVALGGGDPQRLSEQAGVHHVWARNAEHGFIDVHSAADRLPTAEVRNAAGKLVGRIEVPHDDDIEALKLRTPRSINLTAEDGQALQGLVLEPRDMQPGQRYPAVVMVYGGPGVQTIRNEFNPRLLWQHMADRGFVVFQVDNRGSTGRGHGFETPIHHHMGGVELADQLRGVEALRREPFVDGERIGIYGHSYGGYMVALAMLRAAGTFKVGVSGSPVTDRALYDTGYTERYMGTPQNNESGYRGSEVAPHAASLEGKLLIVHALMDENVHFEHTAKLIDALVAADKDFDLLVFPGERHGYRSPTARRYAYRRVVDYFVDHL